MYVGNIFIYVTQQTYISYCSPSHNGIIQVLRLGIMIMFEPCHHRETTSHSQPSIWGCMIICSTGVGGGPHLTAAHSVRQDMCQDALYSKRTWHPSNWQSTACTQLRADPTTSNRSGSALRDGEVSGMGGAGKRNTIARNSVDWHWQVQTNNITDHAEPTTCTHPSAPNRSQRATSEMTAIFGQQNGKVFDMLT